MAGHCCPQLLVDSNVSFYNRKIFRTPSVRYHNIIQKISPEIYESEYFSGFFAILLWST